MEVELVLKQTTIPDNMATMNAELDQEIKF
jgi:hypothetical protein